ncbi:circadian clock protein KaiC [Colwellia sp. C1TZA3]|uniref:circadian clock protein KaiC n=1 Tax=Colwellia sp. C1TZA3 TaxID=2508879 RepID=UPI0011B9B18E|nr:circadian clock protein KaiC [Colwellia sp. C1TZA3]TWX73511.1 circadian clock protein KaiC [Colwellia sp. C1TZA3]
MKPATKQLTNTLGKVVTGISGLDYIAFGGLPKDRTTLVVGTSGSSKTLLAIQFLVEGIRKGEHGVFVTFEESPEDIMRNVSGFGWDLEQYVNEGKLAFVDASPQLDHRDIEIGSYDLGALVARLNYAVKKVQAQRLSVDSLGSIFGQLTATEIVRRELHQIFMKLKTLSVTSMVTAERTEEYGALARYGVEEFAADNVIILRNVLDSERRRRTLEILKFRGSDHCKGEYPFSITVEDGIIVIPLGETRLEQKSSKQRASSGNDVLNEMSGGGYFRDSIVLLSGATGCGKTLLASTFVVAEQGPEERTLFFAYEESREQLTRNADGWGIDFKKLEQSGQLKIICNYPEFLSLEDHLLLIKKSIAEFKPTRIAVDSLSALERVASGKSFREFVIGLTSFIKNEQILGMFTVATPDLLGSASVTDEHISTITDTIIMLRYVEMFGEVHRGIMVLKMRGSMHDKGIRQYQVDSQGMHIGGQFHGISGILSGNPVHVPQNDYDRIGTLFQEE